MFLGMLFTCLSLTIYNVDSAQAEPSDDPKQLLQINQKWTGDFDAMAKRRIIRALVVNSRTHYFVDGAKQRGLAYEGLKEFEKFVNRKLNSKTLKVRIVFIPVVRDQLISGIVNGLGDIAVANLTITPERLKQVDFSTPTITDVKEIIVTGPQADPINSLADLAGKHVYVRRSSSYFSNLQKLSTQFKKEKRHPINIIAMDENLEDEDILEMANAGLIAIVVVDSHKAMFWQKIFKKITVHPNIAVSTGASIGWAFRKNSPKLKTIVDEFVAGHKKGTLFGNILLNRYLKSTKYVSNSLSEAEIEKFNAMIELLQRYGDRYQFDWLMIAAQGYQESHLDQSKRSPVGAVGVMQLLPSTAADKNVNIPDIEKLESNIHAGAKYMRFIVDRYFDDPKIDPLNKILFGFAAYNAGPARISKLRQEAQKTGLDPNVWFDNVEIIAAKRIGRETVQYVGNIYKYWVAYTLIIERRMEKERAMKASPTQP